MIDVVPNAGVIALGKQGENQAVRVTLPNIRAGAGSILLLHQRAADQQPYPVPVVEADGGIIWTVSSTDTAYPGRGQAELQWLGTDGAVIKSVTYQTNVIRALTSPGAVPDEPLKPYTQAVAKDAQAAKDSAENATEAARSAEASAGQAGLSAATAVEAAKNAEAIVGQAGQSAQSAQAAALAAAQNAAAAEAAEAGAKQAQTGAEAARTEALTAKAAAEKAAQEAKTAQTGAVEAKTGAETAQAKAEEAAQGVAADREQIGANAAGLEAATQELTVLKAESTTLKTENTALKAETARTARSLDYLWKKSKGTIYDTETVTGAGSSVTVPSGAMEYAALRKLGGMSRKGYQMLMDDFPGSSSQISVTKSGQYSYAIETLSDGVYRQSGKSQEMNGATGQYTLHAGIVGKGGMIVRFHREDGAKIAEVEIGANNAAKTVNVPEDFAYINIVLLGNTSKSVPIGTRTEISKIMLEAGSAAHPWEPYTDSLLDAPVDAVQVTNAAENSTNDYPIPQDIRDLCPDYGQGTAESYNYIDFAAKAYYHVGSMSQDGTWTALATPEIIDLSAVWPDDDFGVLRVEAGGTINLHYPALDNGFELAVPSETEIMVDVAKVVETDG